jgi:hypothetical protein
MSAPQPAPASGAEGHDWIAYDYAVLRVVPHPHLGVCVPAGVVLHARTAGYVGLRVVTDPAVLAARVPDVDAELLARYLAVLRDVCAGDPAAGPIALWPPSERFHWITAPRSDVIQPGPVHAGVCTDPAGVLERLFHEYVAGA